MIILDKKVNVKGINKPNVTANQLTRVDDVAIYKRSDGEIYEVFIVKVASESEIFGVKYPERELYPNNEDFGRTAWTFTTYTGAKNKFDDILENRK